LFHSKLTDAFRNFANAPKNGLQLHYANGKRSQFISMYKKHTPGVVVILYTCYLFSLCGGAVTRRVLPDFPHSRQLNDMTRPLKRPRPPSPKSFAITSVFTSTLRNILARISKVQPTRCSVFSIYSYKLLYMFQAVNTILCYGSVTWTLTQTSEQMLNTSERKILRRLYGQHMRGDAGVPDGTMNSTAYTGSQTLWRTSKLED
jgi:hypothetical protein